jgi:hypothetical protein
MKAITRKDLEAMTELREELRELQVERKHQVAVLEARIHDLEAVIVELQRKHADLAIVGPWKEGNNYRKGNMATHRGALWACLAETSDRPPSPSWKLVVQRGAVDEPLGPPPERRQPTMPTTTRSNR